MDRKRPLRSSCSGSRRDRTRIAGRLVPTRGIARNGNCRGSLRRARRAHRRQEGNFWQGVGIVDAMFQGLQTLYSDTFASLRSIRFADFSIKANVNTGRDARSDMAAE